MVDDDRSSSLDEILARAARRSRADARRNKSEKGERDSSTTDPTAPSLDGLGGIFDKAAAHARTSYSRIASPGEPAAHDSAVSDPTVTSDATAPTEPETDAAGRPIRSAIDESALGSLQAPSEAPADAIIESGTLDQRVAPAAVQETQSPEAQLASPVEDEIPPAASAAPAPDLSAASQWARPPRSRNWLPAIATAAAILVLVWVHLQRNESVEPPTVAAHTLPSAVPPAPAPATDVRAGQRAAPALVAAAASAAEADSRLTTDPVPPPASIASAASQTLAASGAMATLPTAGGSIDAPRIGIVVDQGNDSSIWVAGQLGANGDAVSATLSTVPATGWLPNLLSLRTQPRVALANYDVLQAARHVPVSMHMPRLEVIAPLNVELLYFIARADSPMKYISDVRGHALNFGPSGATRAFTAHAVYRQMFGVPPPASAAATLNEDAALEALTMDRSQEVVAILGSTAQSALARFLPLASHGLKLLVLDPGNVDSRKATATYLAAPVPDGPFGTFAGGKATTLSVLSFLVTAQGAPNAHEQQDQAIAAFAGTLCRQLKHLREGALAPSPALSPQMQPDVAWPYSASARSALTQCSASPSRLSR